MAGRVAVTGIGVVSSIGIGRELFWKNLIAGKSGIKEISSFDTSPYDTYLGGEITDFSPDRYLEGWRLKRWGRATQLAMTAAKEAINDAKLAPWKYGDENIGVAVGTTMSESQILETIDSEWVATNESSINKDLIALYPSSVLSENISFQFRLKGPSITITTACSAGNYSIGFAHDQIKAGKSRIMLAGGADAFSKIAFTGFNRLFAIAKDNCRPFDKNRSGMVVGEGSAMLILEDMNSALERKAKIYAEILSYALSCDAFHMTAPSIEGIKSVMSKAMKSAKIRPGDIDYISAHGTGTPANDKTECQAIKDTFTPDYKKIAVSSIKSMLGHTMGAASAIEACACCLAIRDSVIPPTINYEAPDPDCDIDCVPNKARKKEIKIALNNSFAFGGNNACLVLRRYEG